MNRYICIHGHFYQPPRENPWLEEIEVQDSAYPYHDWNEKITDECYAPNTASRILDSDGKIIAITNTYAKINFDFGPTLLSWMERQKPEVYQAILDADRLSMENFSGHGSAIAQAYNHMIMPLANKRDRYTQVIWGIKDFEKRFNRYPEGMWLPETAVNIETLEVLASLGIKFTVISQKQAERVRRRDETESWVDASEEKIDPTMPYLCILPSGNSINIFFYDGPIAQEISFGKLLKNGEGFAKKLLSAFSDKRAHDQIVHIATDGETFGHHHRFGDMALSYCLHYIESGNLADITNYGEYLEKHPPTHIVEIVENSSWSCIHGIERWRDNCGCNTGNQPKWNQSWRKPLRDAMDWLRDRIIPVYRSEASKYFEDPWSVRNDYIEIILDRSTKNVKAFLNRHAFRKLVMKEKVSVLKLLEMQKNAMLMYTSCGWFFDDASGIETIQIMQYASKAIQYVEELTGLSLELEYLEYLKKTPCNMYENAAVIYKNFVTPARSDLLRVGAHYSISSIFEDCPEEEMKTFHYTVKSEICNRTEAGRLILSIGKAGISSDITWDTKIIDFAVLHFGDHNISGGARDFERDEAFSIMQSEIMDAFEKGNVHEVIRLMDKHFCNNIYSIWHLFKDEQRKLLNRILQLAYKEAEASYRQIYDNNYAIMNMFNGLNMKLPRPFFAAAEYILNTDLKEIFDHEDLNTKKLKKLIDEAGKWSITIDKTTLDFSVSKWIKTHMERLKRRPEDITLFKRIDKTLQIVKPLSLAPDLWLAQNTYYSIGIDLYNTMKSNASNSDTRAEEWIEGFLKLGCDLKVKM